MTKPRVTTKCVANHYAGPRERIVEFGAGRDGAGGLISFVHHEDGRLTVDLYRMTGKVEVRVSKAEG